MSNKPYKGFEPKWLLTPAPEGSYRSIFRWGDPEFFKYPKESLYKLMKETFRFVSEFEGDVPGACAKDCGNYLMMNLPMARWEAAKYLHEVLECATEENLVYPQ